MNVNLKDYFEKTLSLTKSFVVCFGGRSLNLYEVYQDVKNMARCLKMRWVNFISKRQRQQSLVEIYIN